MAKPSKPNIWMPFYIADYMSATQRLSTEQHGAYVLILFDYWMSGPPPDNNNVLARIAKMTPREWLTMRPILEPFFTIENRQWRNKRLDAEWEKAVSRFEANRENGRKGGRPQKPRQNPSVNPSVNPSLNPWGNPSGNPSGNPDHNPNHNPQKTHPHPQEEQEHKAQKRPSHGNGAGGDNA